MILTIIFIIANFLILSAALSARAIINCINVVTSTDAEAQEKMPCTCIYIFALE